MPLAFALLTNYSLPFALYAAFLDGLSLEDLAQESALSKDWIAERVEAVRLTLTMQVRLSINPQSSYFHPGRMK
jgi:hypothetical protein